MGRETSQAAVGLVVNNVFFEIKRFATRGNKNV
jgi:hypothetical protein